MSDINSDTAALPADDLASWLSQQTPENLQQLHRELQQQLHENGATFDPWHQHHRELDLLPWLISATDWHYLEAGMQQRQRLLGAILQDLYGPQQLLQQGVLPLELVYLNQNFLPPCHNLLQHAEHWLPMLASDIGKDANGKYCILADNSQMPAGLGYVLEHRLAFNHLDSALNQCFDKAQLAGFFHQLQCLLQQGLSNSSVEQHQLCGLLTHSERDAAYFEHAFLANYLDIALVHGADLMFNDGQICLKTLTGLQPLHSMLRYIPSNATDPLELEPDNTGCAGILQSIREKQLFSANPPGSNLLDSGALQPFMAKMCELLLQEPLLLPDTPALWCGDSAQMQQLLQLPLQYSITDIGNSEHWLPVSLNAAELQQLLSKMNEQPERFIARQLQPLQQLPCWNDSALQHQQYGMLRLFSLRRLGQLPQVLPGALGLIGKDNVQLQMPHTTFTSQHFHAKDVWVLANRGQQASLLQSTGNRIRLSRQPGLLPSRVADHLFWMGRYNERLNLICRALRTTLPLLANAGNDSQAQADAHVLLGFCLQANGGQPLTVMPEALGIQRALTQLFSSQNKHGVVAILQNLLFNAQSVREHFSEDTWYVLNKLQTTIHQWPVAPQWQNTAGMLRALDEVVLLQTALYGLNSETMSRTQTLRFMNLGQHLERGLQTANLLSAVFTPPLSTDQYGKRVSATLMEAVLRMADTLMTYRRRYRTQLHPLAIIDLLLLDDSTPRSVGYQCNRLHRQAQQLPQLDIQPPGLSRELRLTVELTSLLQLVDTERLFDDNQVASAELTKLLYQLQQVLRLLSDSITQSYFSHAGVSSAWQSF